MEKMTADELATMLLGGDDKNCVAVMVDDWVGYLSEEYEGNDDHDQPLLTAYENDYDEPFMALTWNDLNKYEKHGDAYYITSSQNNEEFIITPLTVLKS